MEEGCLVLDDLERHCLLGVVPVALNHLAKRALSQHLLDMVPAGSQGLGELGEHAERPAAGRALPASIPRADDIADGHNEVRVFVVPPVIARADGRIGQKVLFRQVHGPGASPNGAYPALAVSKRTGRRQSPQNFVR